MLFITSQIPFMNWFEIEHSYFNTFSHVSNDTSLLRFQTWDVGDPDTHKTKVENHCAALCTAKEMDCTGFYIDKTEVGGSCHLVNDDVLGGGSPTIGHGWRWLDVSEMRETGKAPLIVPPLDSAIFILTLMSK